MKPHSLIAGVALLAASLTLGPPRALGAEAGPNCPEAWRWRTPLGTFELDPEVRGRLKELERSACGRPPGSCARCWPKRPG